MQPIEAVNDFVIKFANVNGSGSASANTLFGKSILRMGVVATPRNIFPSNIQGLPTWYEVRVSDQGHLGCRGGVDLMVAMNPQTWDEDLKSIEPGGYLFYDSTKALPPSKFRKDISVIGVPLTAMCNEAYTDPRQRQLFKNIMYVGALSALLDMDIGAIEALVGEQYKGKDKLIGPNIAALHMGRDWALKNLSCPLGIRLEKSDAVGDRIMLEGNAAAALGAVYGGATVCACTPSHHPPRWPRRFSAGPDGSVWIPRPKREKSPSCRRRTNFLPSVWSSGRPGTVPALLPPPPGPASP